MPRKSSGYWTAMDLGSEEENPSGRVYVDPWDLENYAFMRRHLEESSGVRNREQDNRRSSVLHQRTLPSADSPTLFAGIDELDFHNDNFEVPYDSLHSQGIYYQHHYDEFGQERKLIPRPTTDTGSSLSSGNENYVYTTDGFDPMSPDASLVYVYETATRKRKIALPKSSRSSSSQSRPIMRKFRRIRNIDCMECGLLESSGCYDNYEMDLHTVPSAQPRPPPENFGLSSYGHLKIDYSCSWHSLDKLIKSEQ